MHTASVCAMMTLRHTTRHDSVHVVTSAHRTVATTLATAYNPKKLYILTQYNRVYYYPSQLEYDRPPH